jgi:hypothetical protein
MVAPTDLTKKIKEGLIKSGFPLEMKIGSILEEEGWNNSIGNLYRDFETEKHREIDLTAQKKLNGFQVHLKIACKKSSETQLILYSPQKRSLKTPFFDSYFKLFPKISREQEQEDKYDSKKIFSAFSEFEIFNEKTISNKLIVSRGPSITQDNVTFLTDLNGLVKNSIISGSDGYIESGLRIIYYYILIFDGYIFNLTKSGNEDFDLKDIDYGKLFYEPALKFANSEYLAANDDLVETARKFGNRYVIEIMTPEYFQKYLKNLDWAFSNIDKELLKNWGSDWDDYPGGS